MRDFRGWKCDACGRAGIADFTSQLEWLKKLGMLRREKSPDPQLARELFAGAVGRLGCPACGEARIVLTRDLPRDEGDFPEGKLCAGCGKPIPAERLEALPAATLCAACQTRDDRGEVDEERHFCPRCGSEMALRKVTAGITRYQLVCPACRARA